MEKKKEEEQDSKDENGCKSRCFTSMLQAKLLYFFLCSCNVILQPYLPVYFRHIGMSILQAGLLLSVQPFTVFFSQPVWGVISDKTGHRKLVLITAVAVSVVLSVALYPYSLIPRKEDFATECTQAYNSSIVQKRCLDESLPDMVKYLMGDSWLKFYILFIHVLVLYFFRSAILPVIDASAVALVGRENFGKVRLWGAVGTGSVGFLAGVAISKGSTLVGGRDTSTDFLLAFALYLFLSLLMLALCANLNITPTGRIAAKMLLSHLKRLFSSLQPLLFISAVIISGFGASVVDKFLFVFISDLGGSHIIMGVSLVIMCSFEVIIFPFCGKLLNKVGSSGMLCISLAAMTVRFTYYSLVNSPWLVLLAEPLHGISLSGMLIAIVSYGDIISPPEGRTTILGLINGFGNQGLGAGLGATIGGVVYQYFGHKVLFSSCAVLSVVGMSLLLLGSAIDHQGCSDLEVGSEVDSNDCDCSQTNGEKVSEKSRLLDSP